MPFPQPLPVANTAEPLYLQLLAQLRGAIATGEMPTGQALPSIRVVMQEAGVGMQVVQHAFELAMKEGLIERRRGKPMVVIAAPTQREDRHRALRPDAERLVRHARGLGLSPTDLESVIRWAWRAVGDAGE